MKLELILKTQDGQQSTFAIDQDRLLIGKLASNPICILGDGVEAIHGMIERRDDGTLGIVDLGSGQGIYLNGQKIDVESSLALGDRIKIGSNQLQLAEQRPTLVPPPLPTSPQAAPPTPPPIAPISLGKIDNSPSAAPKSDVVSFEPKAAPPAAHSSAAHTPVAQTPANQAPANQSAAAQTPAAQSSSQGQGSSGGASPSAPMDIRSKQPSPGHSAGREQAITRSPLKPSAKRSPVLFASQKPKSSGSELEVIGYWGRTVIDIELFEQGDKERPHVLIGDDKTNHFPAGGMQPLASHRLAKVRSSGYDIYLRPEMKGTAILEGGKKVELTDKKVSLSKKDIAQISYGSIHYFLMYIKSPDVTLPPTKSRDPLFAGLLALSFLFYCLFVPFIWTSEPTEKDHLDDDPWTVVNLPVKKEPPPPKKKKVELAKVKKPPTPKPPPPKKKPVKPKKPTEAKKIAKKPPVVKPKKEPIKKPPKVVPKVAKPAKAAKAMASTGAKRPDMKLAGRKTNRKLGPAGGNRGAGNGAKGGKRKGKKNFDVKGVEGKKNTKASGVNLSKLGLGIGKILNKTGAGAINTKFKTASGGAGGGAGSGVKTVGLGGFGKGKSLSLAGGANGKNFGSGSGGTGSGLGGLGGAGIGKGFGKGAGGKGRADVVVPPGDPVISGGLTQQEVKTVIQANLNQIRHCYEQLLQRSPSSSGKIKVAFKIAANGRVSTANIQSSTIRDSIMRSCVVSRVKRWQFPKPRGGLEVNVNYPFVFNPL